MLAAWHRMVEIVLVVWKLKSKANQSRRHVRR